ncbi:HAD family hydrolase [Fodinicola acaciae]|uniref:HAD family hydrolase n=1 Tax=Fodinicola acaciae TaxID=2681555 RepID=UPI0013D81AEE|nr:haloacid dehalogenase-like hydrolase [Fodinicola acaciae]
MSIWHVFDMDGTLLAGSTASVQVARQLGRVGELTALEGRFASGDLDTRGFALALRELWQDLTPAVVAAAYESSPWLDRIEDVCADIRARGEHSAVITMSPDFFARLLASRGFDRVVASTFPALPFSMPIDPALILTPADKVRIVDELRRERPARTCVAYGDSISDAPLFRHLSATVAVNADHHLVDIAAAHYRGNDLFEAYEVGRALVAD